MNLLTTLRTDRAENSIMQTITIAVSAILIAAGLVTAPGLINNARDNNARTDLANIAFAQEFALGSSGEYFNLDAVGAPAGVELEGIQYSLSGTTAGHRALVCNDPASFLIRATSDSGATFYRASGSALTTSSFAALPTLPNCIYDQLALQPDFVVFDGMSGDGDGSGDGGDGGGDAGGGGGPVICVDFGNPTSAAYEDGYAAFITGGSPTLPPGAFIGCEWQYESGYAAAAAGGDFEGVFARGTDSDCVNVSEYITRMVPADQNFSNAFYTAWLAGSMAAQIGADGYDEYPVSFGSECDADYAAGYAWGLAAMNP